MTKSLEHEYDKDQDGCTIESCPDEAEIPYAQIPNELIRSKKISPECGHLIMNLLSNKTGWRINVSQLVNHYKGHWGQRKVYNLINEAIKSGYMKRVETRSKNRFGKVKYYVSRTPKYKESLTLGSFEHAENEHGEKGHYKKNDKEERSSYIFKKDDNVSVHNSSASPQELQTPSLKATPYRSSLASKPIVSTPSATEPKFNPATFDPETYSLPSGARLSAKCINSIKKYNSEDRIKLCANLEYFEKMCKKDPNKGEAYLQDCIKHNYAAKELDKFRNMCYATMVILDNKLTHIKVLKSIVKDAESKKDPISLSLPPDTFADALNNLIGIGR